MIYSDRTAFSQQISPMAGSVGRAVPDQMAPMAPAAGMGGGYPSPFGYGGGFPQMMGGGYGQMMGMGGGFPLMMGMGGGFPSPFGYGGGFVPMMNPYAPQTQAYSQAPAIRQQGPAQALAPQPAPVQSPAPQPAPVSAPQSAPTADEEVTGGGYIRMDAPVTSQTIQAISAEPTNAAPKIPAQEQQMLRQQMFGVQGGGNPFAGSGFNPFGGGFSPYGGGFNPYAGFSPYGGGFNPYGGGFSPYGGGFNPYAGYSSPYDG